MTNSNWYKDIKTNIGDNVDVVRRTLLATALSFVAFPSHAGIIDNDSYISDTDSGLDWLDLSYTEGSSFNQVSSELVTGGEFEGWRYATVDEFIGLVSGWTGLSTSGETSDDTSQMNSLMLMMHDEYTGFHKEDEITVWGILADYEITIADSIQHYVGKLEIVEDIQGDEDEGKFVATVSTWNGIAPDDAYDSPYSWSGSYLVRDTSVATVSEPRSIALMGLGLIALSSLRRKKSFGNTALESAS